MTTIKRTPVYNVMTRTALTSDLVKQYGIEAGATIICIASASDFGEAPEGFGPCDMLEGCRSVIVLGVPFSREILNLDPPEYTEHRNAILTKMTVIAKKLAKRIAKDGEYKAKAISASGGKANGKSIDGKSADGKFHGHISLKHAAQLSGMGVITRNYLLTSRLYGNRLWLSAVLTDAQLTPDEKQQFDICQSCELCVKACPSGALDNPGSFGSKQCRKLFVTENKKLIIKCWACRSACPYRFGEAK